ncbi:MAG: hypothetical protein U0359_37160 [Byssovorax sp.]
MNRLPRGWPKDTNPNVVKRVQQVSAMSMDQAKHSLRIAKIDIDIGAAFTALPARIQNDATARGIAAIINGFDGGKKTQSSLVFRLFVFLYDIADRLEEVVRASEPGMRLALLQHFNAAVARRFQGRESIEAGYYATLTGHPNQIPEFLKLGMALASMKWGELVSEVEKKKFVSDIFDSPKGYPKTARSVQDWTRPSQFDIEAKITEWLDGESNQSIYDPNVTGATKSRRAWIVAEHRNYQPGSSGHTLMLSNFIMTIGNAMGLDWNANTAGQRLLGAFTQNRVAVRRAFNNVLSSNDVDALIDTHLGTVWSILF